MNDDIQNEKDAIEIVAFDVDACYRMICRNEWKRLACRAVEIILAPFVFVLCLCIPNRILEDLLGTTHERP